MIAHRDTFMPTLESVQRSGGRVMPEWHPETDRGFCYAGDAGPLDERILERLADGEYLDKIFVNRLSRCPSCRSHHLNFREICIGCKSARIGQVGLLHHFRCGYVAPSYEFTPEDDGRRCPKCHGVLRNRGTDHDAPGPHFVCRSCDISFQTPELGALCLNCGAHTHGADLEHIIFEDVFGYKMTSLGSSALVIGHLVDAWTEDADARSGNGPLMGRGMFMAFLEDERRRARRAHTPFSVLLCGYEPPQAADGAATDERPLIESFAQYLRDTDILGRCDDHHYLALLRFTSEKDAERLIRSVMKSSNPVFAEWKFRANVLRLPEGEPGLDRFMSSLTSVAVDG